MIDRVAVEDVVDPAPGYVAVDRRQRQPTPDREQRPVGGVESRPQVRRPGVGVERPPPFVERVEVAAVVLVVGRPAAGIERLLDVDDRELVPVEDMRDVVEERPVRPTGVRAGGTR
jgi:hypothetical protein